MGERDGEDFRFAVPLALFLSGFVLFFPVIGCNHPVGDSLPELFVVDALSPQPLYRIGGSVTGLSGTGLILRNGSESITLNAPGPFQFMTQHRSGESYDVQITQNPIGGAQGCSVVNGAGLVLDRNVTNIEVICSDNATMTMIVQGLGTAAGDQVTITRNGSDTVTLSANGATGQQTFAVPIAVGSNYTLSAASSTPAGQLCTFTQFGTDTTLSGTVTGALLSVNVYCRNKYIEIANDVNFFGTASHSLAIRGDGSLWGWGLNSQGELGFGSISTAPTCLNPADGSNGYDATNKRCPFPSLIDSSATWSKIAAGMFVSLALRSDGTLWSWGGNTSGILGLGPNPALFCPTYTGTFCPTPTQIGSVTNWSRIDIAQNHAVAIRSDGTLWSWGNNLRGELGNGTTVASDVPIPIGTATNWSAVTVTRTQGSGALRSDGTLWTWGTTTTLALGPTPVTFCPSYNVMSGCLSPTQVGSVMNWSQIDGGDNHILALRSDGTLWSWGANLSGELGTGGGASNVPVQIGTATNWLQVSAGQQHSLALRSDGTLWGWGLNTKGQLGDGTTLNRPAPVPIGTATNWSRIAAGEMYSMGIDSTGQLWSWGGNGQGNLGDGTYTDSTVPKKIW